MSINLKSLRLALAALEIELLDESVDFSDLPSDAYDDTIIAMIFMDHEFGVPPQNTACGCEWCKLYQVSRDLEEKLQELKAVLHMTRPPNVLPASRSVTRWGHIMVNGLKYQVLPPDMNDATRVVQVLAVDELLGTVQVEFEGVTIVGRDVQLSA